MDEAWDLLPAESFRRATKPKVNTRGTTRNGELNVKAYLSMTLLEREIGMTADQYQAFHALQRQRVFERYGVDPS